MTNRIIEARNSLVLGQPFFGALSLRLAVQENANIRTMAVDGQTLRFNPEWIDAAPFDEVVGVTAHEVMHCAAAHHARRGARDHGLWNRACDFAINPLLIAAGFRLPAGALVRDDFKGLSAEEIYSRLRQEQPESDGDQSDDGRQPQDDFGGCGSIEDGPGESAPATEAELAEQAREWNIATQQAAAAAKAAGDMPGAAAYLVEQNRVPRIRWRDVLREFITQRARSEYSWIRPNRRHIHSGLYLPSRERRQLGEMVVAVDTSGSVSNTVLDAFAAEINAIVADTRPERVHIVYCDAQIRGAESFEPDDAPIPMNATGRGGTRFQPVFDWVAERTIDPVCLVYLTDLYGPPAEDPGYPTLWVTIGAAEAPFGEVVKLVLDS
jgi:predicted metal-dependent peptidase